MQETDEKIEPHLASGSKDHNFYISTAEILRDYRLANESRHVSIIGRREVLSGKAKFGIFGSGKEVAQLAMAKAFRKGDFRSGYYRDQTFMFAIGATTIPQFFAQLYAIADVSLEPHSAGRQMNAHFATRSLNENGRFRNLTQQYNSSADISPTGSQMPRLVGLGYASRLYRELDELKQLTQFSNNGDEVAFGTIGNASCAEGMFWESINAIGVLQAPVVLSIWDDGYGISVPNKYQITKGNLSELLKGFQREPNSSEGFDIYTVKGWDYSALVETYQKAADTARRHHVPAIIHVIEMTQPLGHSTSGSHERYKSDERMAFEKDFDCIQRLRKWIIEQRIATAGELDQIERNAGKSIENIRTKMWKAFSRPIYKERQEVADIIEEIVEEIESHAAHQAALSKLHHRLMQKKSPYRRDNMQAVHEVLLLLRDEEVTAVQKLIQWRNKQLAMSQERYGSHLHSQSAKAYTNILEIKPVYSPDSIKL
ncbi:Branched-chain alpha-keto acid dehydrogenase, E1 component, alpha subunit / Branched-chain alpha-keto acid dehydrogenase, E1 component, beta subunit, partial [hydrothermal vent metagenome]